jgi:hypothetical protein
LDAKIWPKAGNVSAVVPVMAVVGDTVEGRKVVGGTEEDASVVGAIVEGGEVHGEIVTMEGATVVGGDAVGDSVDGGMVKVNTESALHVGSSILTVICGMVELPVGHPLKQSNMLSQLVRSESLKVAVVSAGEQTPETEVSSSHTKAR